MNIRGAILIVVTLLLATGLAWILRSPSLRNPGNGSPLPSAPPLLPGQEFDLSTSDGIITVHYSDDYGFAVSPEQVLVRSYIPPCDENFDYCLYLLGGSYAGTNFEGAGLRIKKRADLAAGTGCLNTLPEGYVGFTPQVGRGDGYAASRFGPLQNAAAGHYATGDLYRLSYEGKCYEFETRIGESQFLNFEPGAIRQFADSDRITVREKLRRILDAVTLPENKPVRFP